METKRLFEKDNAWEKVLWKHAQTFSLWQITCVERMLAYGSNMMGAKHYDCGTSKSHLSEQQDEGLQLL